MGGQLGKNGIVKDPAILPPLLVRNENLMYMHDTKRI